jgi:hypothetical protein
MKLLSYIIFVLAIVFWINLFLSNYSETYYWLIKNLKQDIFWNTTELNNIDLKFEQQNKINSKLLESIDKLNENIDKINHPVPTFNSWWINIPKNNDDILWIPDSLYIKLMPDIIVNKINNSWIFNILDNPIFKNVNYSTYYNTKNKLKIFVIDLPYNEILLRFKNLHTIYEIYESNNFFGYTFYLNSIKQDSKTRFITMLEWVTIWFEIDKNNYDFLKQLLLK